MRAPKQGSCPWCGAAMAVGTEDPILERCCPTCARKTLRKLRELNPTFGEVHRKAEAELFAGVKKSGRV